MRRRAVRPALLALAVFLTSGCMCHRPERRFLKEAPGQAWIRTELMFGLKLKDGTVVSEAQWKAFLDAEITPRFPDGLTVVEAYGQWREGATVNAEPSRVLILLHPADPAAGAKLEEIRAAYKARYGQTSVLRATSPVKVSF